MSKRDDGGPAFPGHRYNLSDDGSEQVGEHTWRVPGMSLRDYLAAKAMVAILSQMVGPEAERYYGGVADFDEVSSLSFKQADSMLAERNRRDEIKDAAR